MQNPHVTSSIAALLIVTSGLSAPVQARRGVIPVKTDGRITAEQLFEPQARQIALRGICAPDDDGELAFTGDKTSEAYFNDIRPLDELNALPEEDRKPLLRQVFCSGPAYTAFSAKNPRQSYVFFNSDDRMVLNIRYLLKIGQEAISDAEWADITKLHEEGHALTNRAALNRLQGLKDDAMQGSPLDEAIADSYALCRGLATRQLRPSAFDAWLNFREQVKAEDPTHDVSKFLQPPLTGELKANCSPDRFANKPVRAAQAYLTATRVFLKYHNIK